MIKKARGGQKKPNFLGITNKKRVGGVLFSKSVT